MKIIVEFESYEEFEKNIKKVWDAKPEVKQEVLSETPPQPAKPVEPVAEKPAAEEPKPKRKRRSKKKEEPAPAPASGDGHTIDHVVQAFTELSEICRDLKDPSLLNEYLELKNKIKATCFSNLKAGEVARIENIPPIYFQQVLDMIEQCRLNVVAPVQTNSI